MRCAPDGAAARRGLRGRRQSRLRGRVASLAYAKSTKATATTVMPLAVALSEQREHPERSARSAKRPEGGAKRERPSSKP